MWYSKYQKTLIYSCKITDLYFYLAAACVNRFFCARCIYAGIVVRTVKWSGKDCSLMFPVRAVQTILEEYFICCADCLTGTASQRHLSRCLVSMSRDEHGTCLQEPHRSAPSKKASKLQSRGVQPACRPVLPSLALDWNPVRNTECR